MASSLCEVVVVWLVVFVMLSPTLARDSGMAVSIRDSSGMFGSHSNLSKLPSSHGSKNAQTLVSIKICKRVDAEEKRRWLA